MILKPEFGKKIHGHNMAKYRIESWKGLKLTHEEILYVKYMYHDTQLRHLHEFIAKLREQNAGLIDFIHLFDADTKHLTPYILMYNPKGFEYCWLITFEVDRFNLSYLRVTGSGGNKKTTYWSTGWDRFTAPDAVKLFLSDLVQHPLT